MPDIVVVGKKKCGTKALLTFLLQHPKIKGTREEFKWFGMGNYSNDMKALLGHARERQKFIDWKKGDLMMLKIGNKAVWNITNHPAKVTDGLNMTQFEIRKWRKHVIAIDCLCDPVKRLFSDYLHVKDSHLSKKKKPNSQFLGEHSKLYPFSNMSFGDVVLKYLPLIDQLSNKNPVKIMFKKGLYSPVVAQGKGFEYKCFLRNQFHSSHRKSLLRRPIDSS